MRARLGHCLLVGFTGLCVWVVAPVYAQRDPASRIEIDELRRWLRVVASDETQGRQIFTEGAAIASTYIADELRRAGVAPAGEGGTYFQQVRVLGVRNRGTSTVTVTVKGQSRTFRDGDGVRFARNQGVRRVVEGRAEFVGYGIEYAPLKQHDYAGRTVRDAVVLYLGGSPSSFGERENRVLTGRAREATDVQRAAAVIGPTSVQNQGGQAGNGGSGTAGAGGRSARPDFETAQRLDAPLAPRLTAEDALFEFVFRASGHDYADIKTRASRREPLPRVDLKDVRVRIDLQPDYEVVQTRLSRNVVAKVAGADPVHITTTWVSPRRPVVACPISGACAQACSGPRPGRVTSSSTAPMTTALAP
jgi:hypothetical protein